MGLNQCRRGGPFTTGTESYSTVNGINYVWPVDLQDRYCAKPWTNRNLRIQTGFQDALEAWAINCDFFWFRFGPQDVEVVDENCECEPDPPPTTTTASTTTIAETTSTESTSTTEATTSSAVESTSTTEGPISSTVPTTATTDPSTTTTADSSTTTADTATTTAPSTTTGSEPTTTTTSEPSTTTTTEKPCECTRMEGGHIDAIGTTGGVAFRSGCSFHPDGSALDLHYMRFTNDHVIEPCKRITREGEEAIKRYLALEASLQKYFGETIDHWFNAAHDNHIHVSWRSPGYTGSRLQNRFLQAVMTYFGPTDPNGIDGIWGAGSRAGWEAFTETICAPVRSTPPTTLTEWRHILNVIVMTGFSGRPLGWFPYPAPCPVPEEATG